MIFPATTALFAAFLALVFAGLSVWVAAGRVSDDKLHGDGGDPALSKRIRSHGNFAEYVPLTLILIGLLEASGSSHGAILALLVILLAARLVHPIGMFAPKNSLQQFACRGGGILGTWLVMAASAVLLIIRTL